MLIFAHPNASYGLYGLMAEWLGKGLQNLVQRFESASDLQELHDETALEYSNAVFFTRTCDNKFFERREGAEQVLFCSVLFSSVQLTTTNKQTRRKAPTANKYSPIFAQGSSAKTYLQKFQNR